MNEVNVMQNILTTYKAASSQVIHLQKCELCHGKNVLIDIRHCISNTLGFKQILDIGNYLGLLSMIDISSKVIFKFIYF
jgi:NRPS condensation-like uncharacterized protein